MAGVDWKAYFTFTRRERAGVIVLLALIGIIYAVPEFLPDDHVVSIEYIPDSLRLPRDSTGKAYDVRPDIKRTGKYDHTTAESAPVKFYFDPNTLDEKGWQRLGIQARTIRTILNFRLKGGKFRQPADLKKIYGMSSYDCEQLIPYVRIAPGGSRERLSVKDGSGNERPRSFSGEPDPDSRFRKKAVETIDINKADSAAWEQLPAIGGKLASRIILFREKLGGFYDVQQVAETFGLSDSAFLVISPYLKYSPTLLRMMNINSITAPELAKHPYVRWNVASAIINYRNQHGPFRDLSALKSITVLEPGMADKLLPYLTVE